MDTKIGRRPHFDPEAISVADSAKQSMDRFTLACRNSCSSFASDSATSYSLTAAFLAATASARSAFCRAITSLATLSLSSKVAMADLDFWIWTSSYRTSHVCSPTRFCTCSLLPKNITFSEAVIFFPQSFSRGREWSTFRYYQSKAFCKRKQQ